MYKSTPNHDQAPVALVHQFFHLGILVQVDHRYIAQLVVEITTTGRIVKKIIFAQNVGQGHMLHMNVPCTYQCR